MKNIYRLHFVSFLVIILFTAHAAQSIEFPQGRELQVCLAYAKKYSELNAAQQKLTETMYSAIKHDQEAVVTTDKKLMRVKELMDDLTDRLNTTCPGVGYKCERFISSPKRNSCKPFKIETHHTFVFQTDTYK